MDILLDILIIVAAIIGCAIILIVAVILLAILFDDKNMIEYPLTHVEECNGDCTTCNEEIKEVCKEIQP